MRLNPSPGRTRVFHPNLLALVPRDMLLVALAVFAASLVGTYSRPLGFLATFWPANAVLAGLLIRSPHLRTIPVMLAGCAGYLAAGLLCGDATIAALLLTAANLAGVLVLVVTFGSLERDFRNLNRPQGVAYLLVTAGIASAMAALVGGIAASALTNSPYQEAAVGWFAAELVNYLALLPVMLTLPPPSDWFRGPARHTAQEGALPVLSVAATIALSFVVHHPIAIVFPVPALIWCALTLPMPATTVLVMLYSGIEMVGLKFGLFDTTAFLASDTMTATHLGVALVALGPVLIASMTGNRRAEMEHLERLARYDQLTQVLSRAAFFELGEALIRRLRHDGASVAVLVVDADHFKAINDVHGHPSGDRVLVAISAAMAMSTRERDLFGRLGGEEFAIVLPGVSRDEATFVAERARHAVENLTVVVAGGALQRVTVSIGAVFRHSIETDLGELVSIADHAMYESKRAGRNRVTLIDL